MSIAKLLNQKLKSNLEQNMKKIKETGLLEKARNLLKRRKL